jgi:hypothetical protein
MSKPETTKHTPTPWILSGNMGAIYSMSPEASHGGVADRVCRCGPEGLANAAFIVRACNCHEELLEALRGCLTALDNVNKVGGDTSRDTYIIQAMEARAALVRATQEG